MNRPTWDEYFSEIAEVVSKRSTCRRKVGAVLVIDNKIVSTGYNGSPKGTKHCLENGGCMRELNKITSGTQAEFCRAVHAEQNAIIEAAINGKAIKGATLYVNTYPCSICARMLINAEIKEIVYVADYSDELTKEMLNETNIIIRKMNENK